MTYDPNWVRELRSLLDRAERAVPPLSELTTAEENEWSSAWRAVWAFLDARSTAVDLLNEDAPFASVADGHMAALAESAERTFVDILDRAQVTSVNVLVEIPATVFERMFKPNAVTEGATCISGLGQHARFMDADFDVTRAVVVLSFYDPFREARDGDTIAPVFKRHRFPAAPARDFSRLLEGVLAQIDSKDPR